MNSRQVNMFCEDFLTYTLDESLSLHGAPASNCNSETFKFAENRFVQKVHFRDKHGNTPLHHAVTDPICTWLSVKKYLPFINVKNSLWHTPLHCVIMSNCQNMDIIQSLIINGADINAKDRNGSTVLHKALQNPKCSLKLIDFLIRKGAILNVKQYGHETPLMFAVRSRNPNLEIIEKLMYKGCIDVCAKHAEIHNTLRILCSDVVVIKMFLQYSACIGPTSSEEDYSEDENIIDFSCPNHVCGFKSLEGKFSKSIDLATCLLMYAVKYPSYNMDVIKELLKKGACIYTENCKNSCVLDYALQNPRCSLKLIRELLTYEPPGTQWNAIDRKANSFLHIAALNRSCPVEVMKLLLKKDKCRNLNLENKCDLTPLDCAADFTQNNCCNLEVVEVLLMNGGYTCRSNNQDTSVLWKNIQVLGSPGANRDVLVCTKLLVKYMLVEKTHNVHDAYSFITKACARFRRPDKYGYFAELTSHLNECYTEIMLMMETKCSYFTFFEFVITLSCTLHSLDDKMINQEVFELLISNPFPLYRKFILSLLKKKVLADYMFDTIMYTGNEEGCIHHLNSYCVDYLVHHLENEDVFNLYLAYMDQNDSEEMTNLNDMEMANLSDIHGNVLELDDSDGEEMWNDGS